MPGATFATQRTAFDARSLIRKAQQAFACIAPLTVDLPEKIMETGTTLVDFKALGFLPLGIVSPEGYKFNREMDKEDIDALGYASPVRSDVTKVARQITTTILEKGRRHIQELILGTDLSAVTQDKLTGEIVIDEPDLPINKEYRLVVVAADGPTDTLWIAGKGYGRVKVAEASAEEWAKEGAMQQEITLDVFTDDELGIPVRHYLGGTGALKYKDVLGYVVAP